MEMEQGRQGHGIGLGLFQLQRQMRNSKQILMYVNSLFFRVTQQFIGMNLFAYTVLHSIWKGAKFSLLANIIFFYLQKRRLITHANAKSKSEKFPPPHQDGALGFPLGCSNHMEPSFEPPDPSSFSTVFPFDKSAVPTWSGPLADSAAGNQKRKHKPGRSSKQPATARAR